MTTPSNNLPKPTKKQLLKFILPSLLGILIFLFPIYIDGKVDILIGFISNGLAAIIKPIALPLITILVCISAVLSILVRLFPNSRFAKNSYIKSNFSSSNFYLGVRIIAACFVIMCYFKIGIPLVYNEDNGIMMMELLGTLIAWFFAASFTMPLLMNYGIMEYIGTLLKDFTRPLFKIPGRSTIDLLASWIGNCNVGVILTSKQYEEGFYNAREAITIATCFSAASLPFCLVVAAMLGVDDNFAIFYLILAIVGVISSIIMVRIPPISRYPNTYYEAVGKKIDEEIPAGAKKTSWALHLAVKKAESGPDPKHIIIDGINMFSGIIFTLTPTVMCYGVIACIFANDTPLFNILSLPFGHYLNLLGLEEAFAAAPATIVGFTDMILPAVLGAKIASYETRFVIGILSLVQIIYMTEVGTLILSSKMPIKFRGLLAIFLKKTIICLPIIVLLTRLFGI